MSDRIQALAKQLLGKDSVEACSREEIAQLASNYPYFAPAQFLLLQKLKQENDAAYPAQLQKAILYFHNPVEFEQFISSEKFYSDPAELNPEIAISEEPEHPVTAEKEDVTAALQEITTESPDRSETAAPGFLEPAIELVAEKPTMAEDLVFEPYHTVDYFASQGIKPAQEEAPKDNFGRQLKSFTEWPKTMKRLPVADAPKNIDASAEKKVLHMASHSVNDAEVVTEAMAEVWLKQGNSEKAMEIYNKLLLQNPSKKAFFAAKIENLKRS